VTGYRVTLWSPRDPPLDLRLDEFEVAEAFEVPLEFLLDPATSCATASCTRVASAITMHTVSTVLHLGATAGMLMNLDSFLKG